MSNPRYPNWMYDINEQERLDRLAEQQAEHKPWHGWVGFLGILISAVIVWYIATVLIERWPW